MRRERKYITADEVRALPVGSRVTYHSHDPHGYSTERVCEVVQAGRHKELRYDRWDGFGRMKIIKGKKYSVEVSDNAPGR